MGGSSKSKTPSNTTQTQVPWAPQGQHLAGGGGTPIYEDYNIPGSSTFSGSPLGPPGQLGSGGSTGRRIVGYEGASPGIYNLAEDFFNNRIDNQYAGPVAAGPTSGQQDIATMMLNRATGGNPLLGQAQGQLSDTLAGNYLDFDRFNSAYGEDIRDSINSQFGASGRVGSGYHAENITEGLTDSFTRNVYEPERQRQMAAAGLAPSLQQADYNELQNAAGAAGYGQGLEQQALDAARANQDYGFDANQAALNDYSGIVQGGNYGGTSTTSQDLFRNKNAGLLGGAATGAGLASSLGLGGPAGVGLALGGAFLGK